VAAFASVPVTGCEAANNAMLCGFVAVSDALTAFSPPPPPWAVEIDIHADARQTVLSWIPLGTSVEQARLVLAAKGFKHIEERHENGKACLHVKDIVYGRSLTSREVEVFVDYDDGRVTDIRATLQLICL